MGIDFANPLNLGTNSAADKSGPVESAAPLLRRQKAGPRSDLRFGANINKAIEVLKHEFGINRLVGAGPNAFPDNKPPVVGQNGRGLLKAEHEIFGDMHHINRVDEIEFTCGHNLIPPRLVEIERTPCQGNVGISVAELPLGATSKKCVWFRDEITFDSSQKTALFEPTEQGFAGASRAGADLQNPQSISGRNTLGCKHCSDPIVHRVGQVAIVKISQP